MRGTQILKLPPPPLAQTSTPAPPPIAAPTHTTPHPSTPHCLPHPYLSPPLPLLLAAPFAYVASTPLLLYSVERIVLSPPALAHLGAFRAGVPRHPFLMPDGFIRSSVYFSILDYELPAVKTRLEERLAATG